MRYKQSCLFVLAIEIGDTPRDISSPSMGEDWAGPPEADPPLFPLPSREGGEPFVINHRGKCYPYLYTPQQSCLGFSCYPFESWYI